MTFGERAFDAGGPTLAETGEVEVLRRLREVAASGSIEALVVGPGDDAAVWAPPPGREVALTQDALVEDRDFRRRWIAPRVLGRRALTVSLSDLAGMGARPAWCLATLCAPGDTELEDVLEIQRGLVEAASGAFCAVAGGDVSDTGGPIVIDVTAGGTAARGRWLRRDAGRPGDALLVTGCLGAAAAGLVWLEGGGSDGGDDRATAWVDALLAPTARVAEGLLLAETGVRCAGDISDGLVADAGRTAHASGCGAELWLDDLPVAPGLQRSFPEQWPDLALGGGEDFELLCAVAPDATAGLLAAWPADLAPLREVGRLVEGSGVVLLRRRGGEAVALPQPRSRHWR
ncbi:MAG TPA: thiamine-phosphate kinase [Candidatus Dormibacteraeota bacterium]